MKVVTISMALAIMCGATLTRAQSEGDSITLYGRLYVAFESVEAKGPTQPVPRRNRVEDRVSMFGLRGLEDLGGGLKAFWQFETAFRVDQPGTDYAARNSGVGIQGPYGVVMMGRWDSPMKMTQASVDPFGDIGLGDITTLALRFGEFSQRPANTIQWWSPSWSGVTARVAYAANEGRTATVNPYLFSAAIAYTGRVFYVGYAYEEHRDSVAQTATAGVDEKGQGIAGRVILGGARLVFQYGEYSRTGRTRQRSYMIGGDYATGRWVWLASFQRVWRGQATTASGVVGARCWAAGFNYHFSSRTALAVEYASIDNNELSTFNFGQGPLVPLLAGGLDPRGFAIGLRHVF